MKISVLLFVFLLSSKSISFEIFLKKFAIAVEHNDLDQLKQLGIKLDTNNVDFLRCIGDCKTRLNFRPLSQFINPRATLYISGVLESRESNYIVYFVPQALHSKLAKHGQIFDPMKYKWMKDYAACEFTIRKSEIALGPSFCFNETEGPTFQHGEIYTAE